MEDEPTVKQTHQEYANQLLAENAALKINLENEKSIGQERLSIANSLLSKHAALKSKLKIASAALEVVKVHNGINAHYPIVYATVTQALRDVGEI